LDLRNVNAISEETLVSLQTLSRGLRVLEIIAQTDAGLTIADIADALGVHRAIAYRLVATLEKHLLLIRDKSGRIFLGGGIVGLAARVEPQMREMSRPLLRDMAEKTRATAFMCVGHGEDCVVIQVVEPAGVLLRVGYSVGSRHPIQLGAAGIAIASIRPAKADDSETLRQARLDGYCVTRGQLQAGAVGVAAPLLYPDRGALRFESCVGVVALEDLDTVSAAKAAMECARMLVASGDSPESFKR
jgi:DNA-binding IclR family transcriptional regulator